MSEQQNPAVDETANEAGDQEARADSIADTKVILIVFGTLIVMAVHFISGFTFDF